MNLLFTYLPLLFSLLPHIIEAVKAVETPGLSGADKLGLVVGTITSIFSSLPDNIKTKIDSNVVVKFIENTVGLIVNIFNKSGVFTHSTIAK